MKITNRHAAEARMALSRLNTLDLPVTVSFGLAMLSNAIDEQLLAFSKIRDKLVADYKVKVSIGDKEGTTEFSIPETEGDFLATENAVKEFQTKVNELMLCLGSEIEIEKILLPCTLIIKPETLKPLVPFLEIEGANAS